MSKKTFASSVMSFLRLFTFLFLFSASLSAFNSIINPIVKFGIKGAIWYQGEANGSEEIR